MTRIRVIFFDLDDTLLPSEELYEIGKRAAWRRLRQDYPISWKRFLRLYETARQDVKARLGLVPSARDRLLYFKRMTEIIFGNTRPALALAWFNAYSTCWRHIRPGFVRRLAKRLSKNFHLGVITNQLASFQLAKMRRVDPQGRWFKWIVTSEEAGCEKPCREIFALACRVAGCKPAEAVMVGNDWESDVAGSLRAGFAAVYSHRGSFYRRLPPRCRRVRDLSELESVLSEFSKS